MPLHDLCEPVRKMPATLSLVIVYACALFAAPVGGRYTECLCNFNHDQCVNSKCSTDTSCQRSAVVTSNKRIEIDHVLCGQNGTEDLACNSVHRIHNRIEVHYCCTEPYCNANDTYLFEFIRSRLGDEASDILNSPDTSRPTTTNLPSSKNDNSNKSDKEKVWIIIGYVTVIFILLQIIFVSIALIIGCRKLK